MQEFSNAGHRAWLSRSCGLGGIIRFSVEGKNQKQVSRGNTVKGESRLNGEEARAKGASPKMSFPVFKIAHDPSEMYTCDI